MENKIILRSERLNETKSFEVRSQREKTTVERENLIFPPLLLIEFIILYLSFLVSI